MNRGSENSNFSFDIRERLGVITEKKNGGKKELNLVCWNGREPAKFDIRDWSEDHAHMGRGVTLYQEEIRILTELYQRYEKNLAETEAAGDQEEEHETARQEEECARRDEEAARVAAMRRELKEEVRREMEMEQQSRAAQEIRAQAEGQAQVSNQTQDPAQDEPSVHNEEQEKTHVESVAVSGAGMVAEAALRGNACGQCGSCEEVPF